MPVSPTAVLEPSSKSHENPLFDSAIQQRMVLKPGSRSVTSPQQAESAQKPDVPDDTVQNASADSSPNKPSPLSLAISNSCVLVSEATRAFDSDLKQQDKVGKTSTRPGGEDMHSADEADKKQDPQPKEDASSLHDEPTTPAHGKRKNDIPDVPGPVSLEDTSDIEHMVVKGNGVVRSSWCWEVDSSANDSFDISPPGSDLLFGYASDLEELVEHTKTAPICDEADIPEDAPAIYSMNLADEIQPYDGPPLGCEAAEYWGPEWLEDDGGAMDERLATMTRVWSSAI